MVFVEIDAVVLLHLSCFLNLHPALLGGFLEDVQLLLDLQKGCQQAVHCTVYVHYALLYRHHTSLWLNFSAHKVKANNTIAKKCILSKGYEVKLHGGFNNDYIGGFLKENIYD